MNIQDLIKEHKKGFITFMQVGKPQFICLDDDDFIDYIDYCWEFLDFSQDKLTKVSVYNDDDHEVIIKLGQEVARAHGILELCHKFLSGKYAMPKKNNSKVYTSTLSNERGFFNE